MFYFYFTISIKTALRQTNIYDMVNKSSIRSGIRFYNIRSIKVRYRDIPYYPVYT